MRTTITIDDQLLERAKRRARDRGTTLGGVVEESLHRLLSMPKPSAGPPLPLFESGTGMAPGVDPSSNASLHEISGEDEPQHYTP